MKKSIYVNCRFLTQNITGVQRFAIGICMALKEVDPDIRFISPKNIIQKNIAQKLEVEVIGNYTGHMWEQITLPKYLGKRGKPLLMNLCNTAPVFYSNNALVIHDICGLTHPEWFSRRFHLFYKSIIPAIIKRSKNLFTVSEFSKNEISRYFNYPLENIKVISNAVKQTRPQTGKDLLKSPGSKKYILAVSSVSPRKNFSKIIESYMLLHDKNLELIFVGENYKSFSKVPLNIPNDLTSKIHFLGYVPDNELEELYSNAFAFLYPSLYEGFGIPPLEAMSLGCPVIVSDTTSLPEVCKHGAMYVNPNSSAEITDAVNKLLNDNNYRNDLIKRGYEVAGSYSWADSAARMLQVLKRNTSNSCRIKMPVKSVSNEPI